MIGLLTAFVLRQARIANPLMPLRLFRSRNVTGANLVMGLLVVGFFGMFFLGALYMGDILGYSPLQVGLAFLPSCLVMGTLSLGFAERIIIGIGAWWRPATANASLSSAPIANWLHPSNPACAKTMTITLGTPPSVTVWLSCLVMPSMRSAAALSAATTAACVA